jgi:hypothetical protein
VDDGSDDEPCVAPGSYRVERSDDGGDFQAPLALRLVLAERDAAYWETADTDVSVESATIGFADASHIPAISAMSAEALLTIKATDAVPSDAHLYVRVAADPQPMMPLPSPKGWWNAARRLFGR